MAVAVMTEANENDGGEAGREAIETGFFPVAEKLWRAESQVLIAVLGKFCFLS